jgi:hypothetical protein
LKLETFGAVKTIFAMSPPLRTYIGKDVRADVSHFCKNNRIYINTQGQKTS